MHILFLTQYFPPEMGASAIRISYQAKSFVERGHEVTVLTTFPNYPEGKIFEDYRGRMLMEEHVDGMRILRAWCYASPDKGILPRLLNYCSFTFSSMLLGTLRVGRPDVMLVDSPPLFLGISAIPMKWILGAKLVFNVADLFPEAAVAFGVIENGSVIKAATALEQMIYRHSDLITASTRSMAENIQRRMPNKPVEVLTNGADMAALSAPHRDRTEVRRRFAGGAEFVAGYAGLFGLQHKLETLVDAAAALTSHPEIVFLFFGDGPRKAPVVDKARKLGLQNVKFYPPQPKAQLAEIISSFDVALSPLRDLPMCRCILPMKMFEALGLGIPVICSAPAPGEAQAIIDQSGGGIVTRPESGQEIADAILELYRQRARRLEMGAAAKQYMSRFYNRATIASNFERLLTNLVANGNYGGSAQASEKRSRQGANG
jgi:glycosyltransferase involved in cell wall biosynthesis